MIELLYSSNSSGARSLSRPLALRVAKEVSKALRIQASPLITVTLVDRKTIQRWNALYRGKDYPTDVLSFTYGDGEVYGEVLLCTSVAQKQAREGGQSLRAELTMLLVHGLLHVFGHDHERTKESVKMFALQKMILSKV